MAGLQVRAIAFWMGHYYSPELVPPSVFGGVLLFLPPIHLIQLTQVGVEVHLVQADPLRLLSPLPSRIARSKNWKGDTEGQVS
jgi:hypothetical protein